MPVDVGLPPFPSFKGAARAMGTGKKPATRRTGPRLYQLQAEPGRAGKGPGEPPVDFLNAHNSRDEWDVYWALAVLLGTPPDPRQPPYNGGTTWKYQRSETPADVGFSAGRVPGGSVSDFVVNADTTAPIVIRLQSERFHVFANATVQARDLFIRNHLRGIGRVVDIYSQDFVNDPSGDAVCRVVALALKGIELPSPIRFRTAVRVRR